MWVGDFCILSSRVNLVNWSGLYGCYDIDIGDICGASPPLIHFVTSGTVTLINYYKVGVGSVVMSVVIFNEGAVCGAMSFVNHSQEAWMVNIVIPGCVLKNRNTRIKNFGLVVVNHAENSYISEVNSEVGIAVLLYG